MRDLIDKTGLLDALRARKMTDVIPEYITLPDAERKRICAVAAQTREIINAQPCVHIPDGDHTAGAIYAALEQLKDALAQADGCWIDWIPITADVLPEPKEKVLVWGDNYGYYICSGLEVREVHAWKNPCYSHWARLRPPEGQGADEKG